MIESSVGPKSPNIDDEISVLTVGIVLLRWRRTIIIMGLIGAVLGLLMGLTSTRMYQSYAVFIPQTSDANVSGLAAAASQFGIRVPSTGGSNWGIPVYVELLGSPALLEPVVLDTLQVAEKGGERVALMDLLKVRDPNPSKRTELGIRALDKIITATEVRPLEAVKVTVITPWPSVSYKIAQQLLNGVNRFILEKRKSQATAELEFVEGQTRAAEGALRAAEDKLQSFLQQNRSIGSSPDLTFERDRLQRAVTLQQQTYATWLQSREEARIREVRDTPVITVLEDPKLPIIGEPRNSIQKAVLGAIAGAIIALMIALLSERMAHARRSPSETTQEFFALARNSVPHFLKRGRQ